MGESADYEQMENEMLYEQEQAASAAAKSLEETLKEREAAFAKETGDWWQTGCPFALKDIVLTESGEEGKVIGLPMAGSAPHNHQYGKVWVHLCSLASGLGCRGTASSSCAAARSG